MERRVEIGILFDIYGKLLTKKQFDILKEYCEEDLDLIEIAQNNNVSRQAIQEIVRKGENKLFKYEEKLGIMKKTINQEKQIQDILEQLSKIKNNSSDKSIERILKNIRKELISLKV